MIFRRTHNPATPSSQEEKRKKGSSLYQQRSRLSGAFRLLQRHEPHLWEEEARGAARQHRRRRRTCRRPHDRSRHEGAALSFGLGLGRSGWMVLSVCVCGVLSMQIAKLEEELRKYKLQVRDGCDSGGGRDNKE